MSDFFVTFLIFCITLSIWWILEDRRSSVNLPPGPLRFPIIGSLLSVSFKSDIPAIVFANLAKIYGDVMYLKMGASDTVVFSAHEAAKEILNHDNANDTDLVGFVSDRNMDQNVGIILASGEVWQTLRKFTIRTLREFGFGKSGSMDVVINEELVKFVGHFDKTLNCNGNNGKMLVTMELFDMSVVNVLWRLVTGKSYELEDGRLKELLRLSNELVHSSSYSGDLSTIFPFLHDWLPDWWTGRNRTKKCVQKLCDFCREAINEHRQSDTYGTKPESFVDVFLSKIDDNKDHPIFNDKQLIYTMLDLFQAGADTSSSTLTFALLYLTLYPDKQDKVHEELDAVLQKDDVITVAMKSKLPYCTAALLEILRFSSILPFTPNRKAAADFQLRNYTIKKGTKIMVNLQALHFDEAVWGDPQVFRPERFLTKDNLVDKRMSDLVMAFGGGRRVCLGQNLAEATTFKYFTSVFRYFKLERVVDGNEALVPSTVPIVGLGYSPRPFEAQVTRKVFA